MRRNLLLAAGAALIVVAGAVVWSARSDGSDAPEVATLQSVALDVQGVADAEGDLGGFQARTSSLEAPAAGAPAVVGEGGAEPGASPLVTDRKIVQTASLTLEVERVSEAFEEVGRIASTRGGFVSSSTFANDGDQQVGSITIRVPASAYQATLASLRGLATSVEREQSEAGDVTEEYSDLNARLRNLQATEAQYLEFLKRAETIEEVLLVQDRLNGVRAEIEQVQGRINLLDNLADLATITIHLRPDTALAVDGGGGGPDPAESARAAWDASLNALLGIASGIVAVAAFSWWLLPPLALVAFGVRQGLSRRHRAEAG